MNSTLLQQGFRCVLAGVQAPLDVQIFNGFLLRVFLGQWFVTDAISSLEWSEFQFYVCHNQWSPNCKYKNSDLSSSGYFDDFKGFFHSCCKLLRNICDSNRLFPCIEPPHDTEMVCSRVRNNSDQKIANTYDALAS